MSDAALEMRHVCKKFLRGEKHGSLRDFVPSVALNLFRRAGSNGLQENEFWALDDISFAIKRGESLGIIGPNGAGKSTVLKILTKIMNPTSGNVSCAGRLSALIEIGAGFHQDLTGRENIFLNGTILGMNREEIKRKFDEIVEFSGLADFIDTPVKRYSSGMFARLGFSVAAHVDPEILIVDEVLSVGDYLFQRKCVEKMHAIMKSGVTLIFVSHDLKTVGDICSRTLLLEKGKAVMLGPTGNVIQHYLNRHVKGCADSQEKEVCISKVTVRGEEGPGTHFAPGEKAFVDIEVTSNVPLNQLSLSLYMQDRNYYNLFDTSTQRLNNMTFSPKSGETWRCTFEIVLHLTEGSYYLGVLIYQYNIEKLYDEWFPAETIFVSSTKDVRGGANLYPRVVALQRDH